TADDLLPNVRSGEAAQRAVSFLFSSAPQETAQYTLDVGYPLGSQRQLPLVRNVAIESRIQRLADVARFEVVGTHLDLLTNEDNQRAYSARLDFRVENAGSEPIQNLAAECFWYSTNGDPLDRSTDYLIGDGDTPLGAGQSKTGSLRCGKASPTKKAPVRADVYLRSGDQRLLVQKGLTVQ
ncbi:MAG TPA: hypothetical protein VL970_11390, partial [Candidatus Acidoferrales bacterium]|nr:hypothetical protein [Candidatus Acidoferrales bacterium]